MVTHKTGTCATRRTGRCGSGTFTGAAVRFGGAASSCSRYGRIGQPVTVPTAVAASAAHPLLLPALERQFTFTRGGRQRTEPVLLSDGGIYDNLGLSVLEPGRSPDFSDHEKATPETLWRDFLERDGAATKRRRLGRARDAGRPGVHRRRCSMTDKSVKQQASGSSTDDDRPRHLDLSGFVNQRATATQNAGPSKLAGSNHDGEGAVMYR